MKTLQEARTNLGITQEQMANYLGVHRNTYDRYEARPGTIPAGKAKKICAALGIKAAEFFLLVTDT